MLILNTAINKIIYHKNCNMLIYSLVMISFKVLPTIIDIFFYFIAAITELHDWISYQGYVFLIMNVTRPNVCIHKIN